jgi:hypothetical protein
MQLQSFMIVIMHTYAISHALASVVYIKNIVKSKGVAGSPAKQTTQKAR